MIFYSFMDEPFTLHFRTAKVRHHCLLNGYRSGDRILLC